MTPLDSWDFLLRLFAAVGFLTALWIYFMPELSIPPAPVLFENKKEADKDE